MSNQSTAVDDWVEKGACGQANAADRDAFFTPERESRAKRVEREQYVVNRYCNWCPVRAECSAGMARELYGIWGGTTELDRALRALGLEVPETMRPMTVRQVVELTGISYHRINRQIRAGCIRCVGRAKKASEGGEPARLFRFEDLVLAAWRAAAK